VVLLNSGEGSRPDRPQDSGKLDEHVQYTLTPFCSDRCEVAADRIDMPLTAIMSYVIRSPNDATVDMRRPPDPRTSTSGCLSDVSGGFPLRGRAPDVFSPRTLWSVLAKRIFHAVTHSQHVDGFAVNSALMKGVFLVAIIPYESESLVRPQRLNFSCHSSASLDVVR
jgi:endogenous inhibitor of DNA gyrase (YacG/DUF329 family)